MSQVHYGHVFHVAGRPTVTESAAALVDIPDGALVVDDSGRIIFCGSRAELPAEFGSARRPFDCVYAGSTAKIPRHVTNREPEAGNQTLRAVVLDV